MPRIPDVSESIRGRSDRRVEVFAPVYDERLRRRLDALIVLWLADERQFWQLDADATWRRLSPESRARGPHEVLIKEPWGPQGTA